MNVIIETGYRRIIDDKHLIGIMLVTLAQFGLVFFRFDVVQGNLKTTIGVDMLDSATRSVLPELVAFLAVALDELQRLALPSHVKTQIVVSEFAVLGETEDLVSALAVTIKCADIVILFFA